MREYTEVEAQADADALIARLEAEPGLRDALIADPRGTLVEAGLRPDTIAEIEEALAGTEVEGFAQFGRGMPGPGGHTTDAQTIGTSGTSVIFGGVVAVSGTSVVVPGTSIVHPQGGMGQAGSA
jgi:hypothetical protein